MPKHVSILADKPDIVSYLYVYVNSNLCKNGSGHNDVTKLNWVFNLRHTLHSVTRISIIKRVRRTANSDY
jgi:hypothetical protein